MDHPFSDSFIHCVEEQLHNKSILASVHISVDKYPFLIDHSFKKQIIIPAVLFLEFFAQTAKVLFPRKVMSKIVNAEFTHLLTLKKNEEQQLYCSLSNEGTSDMPFLKADVYYYFENKSLKLKRKKTIAKISAELSEKHYNSQNDSTFPFFSASDLIIEKDEIYSDLVGLAESFNHLDSVLQMSSTKGAVAKLIKSPVPKVNIDCNSLVLGDLFLRDSSYHLASIWGSHFIGGFNVPFKMKNVNFYKSLTDTDEYHCVAKPLGNDKKVSIYNLLIYNTSGELIEEYEKISYTHNVEVAEDNSVEQKIAERKKQVLDFEALLSQLKNSLPHFGVCNIAFIKKNHLYFTNLLSSVELKLYHKYFRESTRLEFLGGRVLLKSLLINALKEDSQKSLDFKDISIDRKTTGSPQLFIRGIRDKTISVSISHKGDYIFVALDLSSKIGIDVEKVDVKLKKIKSKFMDKYEEKLIEKEINSNPNEKSLLEEYCKLWTSKEALVKLLNGDTGLLETARKAKLTEINNDLFTLSYCHNDRELTLKSHNFVYSDYIFTVVKEK